MILRLMESGAQVRAELFAADKTQLAAGTLADVETAALKLPAMVSALDSLAGNDLVTLGEHLGSLLLPPDVWSKLRDAPLPALLRIDIPAPLVNVPWELALPAGRPTGPFLNTDFLIYRGAEGENRSTAKAVWPLRVLIIVGAAEDDSNIQAAPERDGLRQQLFDYGHSFDVELLERPTHKQLVTTIEDLQPHIIHFIGHSDTEEGVSFLDIRGKNPWHWSTEDFEPDFKKWTPNFLFLNACRTAASDPRQASVGVARAMMGAGVPGVLSMQADIAGEHAKIFSSTFYQGLACGKNLAAAVAEGRDQLRKEVPEKTIRRWALPVLTLVAPPEEIIPVRRSSSSPQLAEIAAVFPETRLFALRHLERREFVANLQPVVFVTGESEIGKSHLVRWCLEGFALHGHGVHYVNRKAGGRLELVDLLRMVLREARPAGLPEDCFHRFHFELRNLLTLGVKGEWNGAAEPFCELPADPSKFKSDDTIRNVIDSFLDCVKTCVGRQQPGTKFFLVVDQLEESVEPRHLQKDGLVLSTLTRAIRDKNIPGFHLVLVLRQASAPDLKEAADKKLVTLLSLEGLPKAVCQDFLNEAIRYRTHLVPKHIVEFFAGRVKDDPFRPSALTSTLIFLQDSLGALERMK